MHPYSNLPDKNFWKKSISNLPWSNINLIDRPKFYISTDNLIASAGSCFAQHINRYLSSAGFIPYVVEKAHPIECQFNGEIESYQQFSARFGNIYTARQMLELLKQATGQVQIVHDYCVDNDRWFDLLRPNVFKTGFNNYEEISADRIFHLTKVKEMFENCDIFIFTLGLTEAWINTKKKYTYPVCPGTIKGNYDANNYSFKNFNYDDICNDLEELVQILNTINSKIKIILTVSPVPLVATYTSSNVLVASTYSKSVLRASVEKIIMKHENVAYFPSYEIISSPASFGQYLASDLREVTERGVSHVMSQFMTTFFEKSTLNKTVATRKFDSSDNFMPDLSKTLPDCDEMYNEFNDSK
jgi:hypothetical protein